LFAEQPNQLAATRRWYSAPLLESSLGTCHSGLDGIGTLEANLAKHATVGG
jgi:hypothetical protein